MEVLRTARYRLGSLWPWVVPLAVLAFIYETHGRFLQRLVSALLAAAVVLLAARRADRALLILIIGLPFQGLVLAQAYAWGLPADVVRPLSSWKEALAVGLVIAGVQGWRAGRRHLDALDRLGLAYVAIISAYALLPNLFAPGAPTATNARSLAFRATAGFVVLLLAARHADLPPDFASRATRVVMIVGTVVAGVALYEYFFSNAWNSFVINDVQYVRYELNVLHVAPFSYTDIRRYADIAGQHVVRTGSVFLDPTPCGFFLLLPFAAAVERRLRPAIQPAGAFLLLVIGSGLVLTQTRAALVGALTILYLALRPVAGRTSARRMQFALIFAAAVFIAFPAISATGLTHRVASTTSGQDQSSTDHLQSFWNGVHAIEARPLGYGIGTSAGVGQRFAVATSTITENNYLEVGVETGVVAMAIFVALTVAMLRRLRRAARTADPGASAIRSAGVGLAVAVFLLHGWNEFAVSWVFWALAGAAIALADRASTPTERPAQSKLLFSANTGGAPL
jgi:hypothetical protein